MTDTDVPATVSGSQDPLLTVALDRWRHVARAPRATADTPFGAPADGPVLGAYAADLGALLAVAVDPYDIARCTTPRALAGLLRERRRGGTDSPTGTESSRTAVATEATESGEAAGATEKHGTWEATPGQSGIWYLSEFGDAPTAYNSPILLRTAQRLDPHPLRRALRHVVARHDSLRTTFESAPDGRLLQRVGAEPRFGFAAGAVAGEDELRRWAGEFAVRRFDLAAGPLLDAACLDLATGGTALLVNAHHAVFDGFSWSVLLTELLTVYRALAAGDEPPRSPAPRQFRDVITARRQGVTFHDPQFAVDSLAYWTKHLADPPAPLDLAPGRARGQSAVAAASVRTVLTAAETGRLRERAAAEGMTPLMVLLTAYAALLHRHTGRADLTVGLPVSLRERAADQDVIGHLVNTVVLRHRMDPADTGRELLARTRAEVLGAMRHKDVAFEQVVEAVNPGRDGGGAPLFQTMVTLMPADRRALGGAAGDLLGGASDGWRHLSSAPKYDLVLVVEEGTDDLALVFEYDPGRLDPEVAERIPGRFRTLLTGLIERPGTPVGELDWVPDAELAELTDVWHGATDERPARQSPHRLFEERARLTPDAVAVEPATGPAWTYRELDAAANRLARALRERGAHTGHRVALSLDRGVDAVVALLAVVKTGASYVPLDPAYPRERLSLMLADARPRLLLTRGRPPVELPDGTAVFDLDAEDRFVAGQAERALSVHRRPDDELYVVYTSGTTGRPKGVVINDLTITNLVHRQADLSGPHAGARTLQYMSLSFDVSFEEIFGTLGAGGTLVLTDEDTRTDLHRLAALLAERRVERVFLPYVALQELASVVVRGGRALPHLAEVYTTGEQLVVTPQLRRMFADFTDADLVNVYGPSEAHLCTGHRLTGDPALWPERPPIGHTVGNVRMYVLDERLRPVPFGVPGELYVGGDVLSPGYLNLPGQTRDRYRSDPFVADPGARLYRTGDLVLCTPGEGFTHLGRVDEQIKIRGYRIEPAEVEAALNDLPSVTASAVVAAEYGPGDRRLVAFVRLDGATSAAQDGELPLDESELRAALGVGLPSYLVPSRFVRVGRLPTGPSGKTDRAALAERAARLPAPRRAGRTGRALTGTERRVAGIWAELLSGADAGPDDDFFALGGHSLLAVRLRQALQDAWGVELPLGALLSAPTVTGMADRVERALTGRDTFDDGPDLWADTRLPAGFSTASAAPAVAADAARTVLLTGVTGFLGIYLLRSLLAAGSEVHCLVRADSPRAGLARILETARRYRADDGLDLSRVRVVAGDLAQERFGLGAADYRDLAGRIEAVYHAAAHINFAAPYVSVKPTNVDGFVRIAEFCAQTVLKPLHHMSTLAVFAPGGPAREFTEDSVPDTADGLGIGYAQSKWVAERLALAARDKGVPVTVHRIGRIGPDTVSGACRTDDFFWLQIKSFLQLGVAPEELGAPVDLLPVDVVADAVVRLARAPEAHNRAVHVFHPAGLDWESVLGAVAEVAGAAPRRVPTAAWLAATASAGSGSGPSLASLVPLFQEGVMELGEHRYRNDETVALLKDLGLELPAADPSWITAMIRYFTESGQITGARVP